MSKKETRKFKPGERLIERMFKRALTLQALPGSPFEVPLSCTWAGQKLTNIVLTAVVIPDVRVMRIGSEKLKLVPEVPGEMSHHRQVVKEYLRMLLLKRVAS